MGYLRSRGALRVAVIVRECPFILIKLSKFNSLITFCSICPINWMYCSKIDAQRLVISLHSRLILTEPLITSFQPFIFKKKTVFSGPNVLAYVDSLNGIVSDLVKFAKVYSPRLE